MNKKEKGILGSIMGNLIGTGIKYASLMAGIYYIFNDEQLFIPMTISGIGYITGELINQGAKMNYSDKRLSELEEKVKKTS